jgi:hypothetical protein
MPLVVPGVAMTFLSAGRKSLVKAERVLETFRTHFRREMVWYLVNRTTICLFCPEAGRTGHFQRRAPS